MDFAHTRSRFYEVGVTVALPGRLLVSKLAPDPGNYCGTRWSQEVPLKWGIAGSVTS